MADQLEEESGIPSEPLRFTHLTITVRPHAHSDLQWQVLVESRILNGRMWRLQTFVEDFVPMEAILVTVARTLTAFRHEGVLHEQRMRDDVIDELRRLDDSPF